MPTSSAKCLRRRLTAAGLCLLPLFTACTGPFTPRQLELAPVSGKLTLDGEPVAGAKVVFLPRKLFADQALPHPPAAAITDQQGVYRLQTDGTEGAPPGEYLVLVSKRDDQSTIEETEISLLEMARGLEERPSDAATEPWMSAETIPSFFNWQTNLRLTIPSGGNSQADLELSLSDLPLDRPDRLGK